MNTRIPIKTGMDGAVVLLISSGVGLITASSDNSTRAVGIVLIVLGLFGYVLRNFWNERSKEKLNEDRKG